MKNKIVKYLIFAVFVFGHLKLMAAPFVEQKQKVNVEFRLAGNKPSPGLREMSLAGSMLKFYVSDKAVFSNKDIVEANINIQPAAQDKYLIELVFSKKTSSAFADFTKENKNKFLAILVEGKLISAPFISQEIKEGKININGNFAKEEATRIAKGIIEGKYEEPVVDKDINENQALTEPLKANLINYSDNRIAFSYNSSFKFSRDEKMNMYSLSLDNLGIVIMDTSGYILKETLKDQAEMMKISFQAAAKDPRTEGMMKNQKIIGPAEIAFKHSSGYFLILENTLDLQKSVSEVYLLVSNDKTLHVSVNMAQENIEKYRNVIANLLNSIELK